MTRKKPLAVSDTSRTGKWFRSICQRHGKKSGYALKLMEKEMDVVIANLKVDKTKDKK